MLLYFVMSFIFASALIAELCLGLLGVPVPIVGIAGIYYTVTQKWDRTVIPFLVASTLLDLSFGRMLPLSILIVPVILIAGSYWREHGNTASLLAQVVPGAFAGVIALCILFLHSILYGLASERAGAMISLRYVVQEVLVSAFAMPVIVALLDKVMVPFGCKKYSAAGDFFRSMSSDE